MVTVTAKGKQDQQGNKIIELPSASKGTGSTAQGSSELGKGRQKVHSAELVLLDEVNGTHCTLEASAHPLAPAQWPLHSLSCGLINYCSPACTITSSTHPPASQGPPQAPAEQDEE